MEYFYFILVAFYNNKVSGNAVRQEGNGCSTKHKESPTASTGGGEWENILFLYC